MRFGEFEVKLFNSGLFRLDGGAMFGVVPKPLWHKKQDCDERNRIYMCNNLAVISGKGKIILVDAGNPANPEAKFKDIYAIDNSKFNLNKGLSDMGLKFEDITDVILTHLHFDHVGGAVKEDQDGYMIPAFPNAVYHVQKKQLQWAMKPSFKDKASFVSTYLNPLTENNVLNILDGPQELFPGIELLCFDGHTPAQQLPLVKGTDGSFFFGGDLFPMHSHVSIPWVMAYDIEPIKTISEKERLLQQAVDKNWIFAFEHDPVMASGTIKKTEKGFDFDQEVAL